VKCDPRIYRKKYVKKGKQIKKEVILMNERTNKIKCEGENGLSK
jgi:hypothetical protein